MSPSAIARDVRNLQIRTRMRVDSALAGQYRSIFKGRGIEFEEAREYVAGDDIRDIDWNVTARAGKPYVKTYTEERDLTVVFAVDASASTAFASGARSKAATAAGFCALVSLSAIRNHDRAGLLLFTDAVERFIPPAKGMTHVTRLLREVIALQVAGRRTDIRAALDFIGRVLHRRSIVFLVSDFQAEGFEGALRIVAKRHDLIAVWITDPREHVLPDFGLAGIEDLETGVRVVVDTGREDVRALFESRARRRSAGLRNLFGSAGVDSIEISNSEDYVEPLVRFFERRGRRR